MSYTDYLLGEIYHMVHINNLCSIFQQGGILSKEKLSQANLYHHSIAYESVQGLRDRIFVRDLADKYRKLHSYVPFYFTTNSPMFHVQRKNGLEDQIAFLVVSRNVLVASGVLFTDGNAAIQQLAQSGTEKVGITPATTSTPCTRVYLPNGPHGTNQSMSNFYNDVTLLSYLNWYVLRGGYIADWEESKRVRSAEILIPDELFIKEVQYIAVKKEETIRKINTLFTQCKSVNKIPQVLARPDLYNV